MTYISYLHRTRTIWTLVAVPPLLLEGLSVKAQQPEPHAQVPGVYAPQRCDPAPFPIQLPPLNSVLDSASLAAALKSAGVNKRLVLGLRLGTLEATPRVHVIERKVPTRIADRAAAQLEASIRPVPVDRDWAFRVRVEIQGDLVITLERSQLCGATPRAMKALNATPMPVVTNEDLLRLRDAASRRRSMRHRVLVDADGRVLAVELTNSSGDARMDSAQAATLKDRTFTPSTLDGMPVVAWVEIRGDYRLYNP